MRDRKQTEAEILNAVNRLITSRGFQAIGINAIAQEAGVSKVLIYRYFENLDGLMEAWARENSFWISKPEDEVLNRPPLKAAEKIFHGYLAGLRTDRGRREMLKWLLAEETRTGKKIMDQNEKGGLELTSYFESCLPENKEKETPDTKALFAILTAGLSYLTLIGDRTDIFNGVPLDSEEGWERIEKTINRILDNYYSM